MTGYQSWRNPCDKNITRILLSCSHVRTTMWIHYQDSNETNGEKVTWKLYKNVVCCFEQILVASPLKTATVRPLTSYPRNQPRWIKHIGHCWRSRDKLISSVPLWTPTHGHTSVGNLAKTYIHLVCANTGYSLADLLNAIVYSSNYQFGMHANISVGFVLSTS